MSISLENQVENQAVRLAEGMCNGAAGRLWHPSAPKPVRQAFRAGRSDEGWDHWTAYLGRRRQPAPVAELLPGTSSPLSWALPEEVTAGAAATRLGQLERLATRPARNGAAEGLAAAWLAATPAAVVSVGEALEALAWAQALPRLAGSLSAARWWTLVDRLLELAAAAEQGGLEESPLVHQLLAGELRLTLGYLLPELVPCRSLTPAARAALSGGLCELLDADGPPQGQHLAHLRPLLACWTRCRALGAQLSQGAWNAEAEGYYQWLVRAALRLTRADGSQVLAPGTAGVWCRDLFEAALEFGGDDEDRAIAALVLPGAKKLKGRAAKVAVPVASNHSEWAAVSTLRSGWPRSEPRLTVVYPGKELHVELESGSELLCSGLWRTEVACDGKPLEVESEWEEVCWVSDEDIDYLELELPLEGDWRLQRHLALGRKERVLLLADSLLGSGSATLEYRTILPLGAGVKFQGAKETQEGFLVGKRQQALVLPLALPEWRSAPSPDWLQATERGLELQQTSSGPCLFAPLWFDLDPRRMTRPRTWRSLTVAENRQTLTRQTAVGYRVMTGKRQWLLYRSLAKAANRTVLGHNLSTQMLLATFHRGEVEPLVEIE